MQASFHELQILLLPSLLAAKTLPELHTVMTALFGILLYFKLGEKQKTRSSLSHVPKCPWPWPSFSSLLVSTWLYPSFCQRPMSTKATLSSIFFTFRKIRILCNVSLTPILACLRAVESTGSFIRVFMTAHQTTGTDLKRYNRFQAPD